MKKDGVDAARLEADFRQRYGSAPRVFSAPGRVNLIGEHTDYNDGFVLPMAIGLRTLVLAAPRDDRRVVAYSRTLERSFEFDLDRPGPKRRGIWGDYLEGTARALEERGIAMVGASLLIDSEVPAGAGLSASAALEVSVGLALASLAGQPGLDRILLAKAGQSAEHEYVGTLCGIMDQYIAALGQPGHALLIDCRSLAARPIPLAIEGATLVVCDTRAKHELSTSAYNQRRAECQTAASLLSAVIPGVTSLRDVSTAAFEEHQERLPPVVRARARHVVTENARTLDAVAAFESGDLARVGQCMNESHRSLRDDYEVSSPELDAAVDAALETPGVFGARMTGGGFGGSAIALVKSEAADSVMPAMSGAVNTRFQTGAVAFATHAHGGAREDFRGS